MNRDYRQYSVLFFGLFLLMTDYLFTTSKISTTEPFQHLPIYFYKMQLWKVKIRTLLFYVIKKYFISKACVSCDPLENISKLAFGDKSLVVTCTYMLR